MTTTDTTNPREKLLPYQTIEELAVGLRRAGYNQENVGAHFEYARRDTINALLRETEDGRLRLDQDPGRTIWKSVITSYQKGGLTQELEGVALRLYEATAPPKRRIMKKWGADFVGGLAAAGTLGLMLAEPVINEIYGNGAYKYLAKVLGIELKR